MIKIGIVGCGSITKYRHFPEINGNKNAKLVGFYDPVKEIAEKYAKKVDGIVFESLSELAGSDKIDAVVISTPNKFHGPYSIKCLNQGKHVLCEKPMAVSMEEARKMIEAAKKNNVKLMIGHNQRLAPAHVKAKEILDSGELGKVLTFQTSFGHGGADKWSIQGKKSWFLKKELAFAGVMGDLGIHKVDLIRFLLNDELKECKAYVDTIDKTYENGEKITVEDNAICLLKFKKGTIGTMQASWTHYGKEDNSTTLYCENGVMEIYKDPKFNLVITKKGKNEKQCFEIGRIQTNEDQSDSGISKAFIEAIKLDKEVPISGYEGMKALEIILKCLEDNEK